MTEPIISVIMPTYNQGAFVKKSISSVLSQSYRNIELIVVDNYSQDCTEKVVTAYQDNRIKYFKFKNKGVIAASRNFGIDNSKGEYIAFLDSDDLWYPQKLEKCLEKFKARVDLVSHGMSYIRNGKHWKDVMCGSPKMADYLNLLYNGNCIITSATVVRKNCLKRVSGFDENPAIISAEDYDLWLRLAKEKVYFSFINEILGEYTYHDNSISKQEMKHFRASMTVVNKHFVLKKKNTLFDFLKLRRAKALFLYGIARNFQHNGKSIKSLSFFLKAIKVFPFLLKVYVGILFIFLPQCVVNKVAYYK
jgi:glycosyltransferase involved in cell wall biosynthesis